jgi:2-keto-4-pentenoate hydratase/2-oxohepta-3-ene-1,7-dioic acid hydratase in catechol pathway
MRLYTFEANKRQRIGADRRYRYDRNACWHRIFRKPQTFLKPGDVCELEISGIGKLVNPVAKDEYRF